MEINEKAGFYSDLEKKPSRTLNGENHFLGGHRALAFDDALVRALVFILNVPDLHHTVEVVVVGAVRHPAPHLSPGKRPGLGVVRSPGVRNLLIYNWKKLTC